jgi:hypothetical protein
MAQILFNQSLIVEIIKQTMKYLVIGLPILQPETGVHEEKSCSSRFARRLWVSRSSLHLESARGDASDKVRDVAVFDNNGGPVRLEASSRTRPIRLVSSPRLPMFFAAGVERDD